MSDNINPEHYKSGGIETIEYIRAKMTKEEFYGYIKGNVMKYVSRVDKKSDKLLDKIDDLKKAQWYLNRLIEITTREEQQSGKDNRNTNT